MKTIEEKLDLFKVLNDYTLVHCISQDYAMGASISVEFEIKYKLCSN